MAGEVIPIPVVGKASSVELSHVGEDAASSSLDRGDVS